MKKQLLVIIILILGMHSLHASCSTSQSFWRNKIAKSPTIEQFFIENYGCKGSFYRTLKRSEKLYFDTVTYPQGLSKRAYQNRWQAMTLNDTSFFKRFSTFNNYFNTYRSTITSQQLGCFQRQHHFPQPVPAQTFYNELHKRHMTNDVSYLYPLIRWSYMNSGTDMDLSAKRVNQAERDFGIKKGKVGDKQQFARYLALFDAEYQDIAQSLAGHLKIEPIEAYKIMVVLTYLESRGNIFAVSTTGAFGPLQLTMHYYLLYGEPNNPFNPKSSLAKLANKFVHYAHINKSIDASVIAYKSGSLEKCQEGGSADVDCRYYQDFKRLTHAMRGMHRKGDISRYLTKKSYFFPELVQLKRFRNPKQLKDYEPYQYAVLKGEPLSDRAIESKYLLSGQNFNSLGKMKRSDIYKLQNRYGTENIGVVSDKKVCY